MDLEQLIKLLKENKVDFVIIGATAFPVYGYVRVTLDTDIFILSTEENAQRTLKALREFGYDVTDIKVKDLLEKKILIRQSALEVDIHPCVTGISFEKVWENKVKSKIGKTESYFASLKDLIRMKKAAARTKDKEDLKYLIKLSRRKISEPIKQE